YVSVFLRGPSCPSWLQVLNACNTKDTKVHEGNRDLLLSVGSERPHRIAHRTHWPAWACHCRNRWTLLQCAQQRNIVNRQIKRDKLVVGAHCFNDAALART